jgi:hypothetical protein
VTCLFNGVRKIQIAFQKVRWEMTASSNHTVKRRHDEHRLSSDMDYETEVLASVSYHAKRIRGDVKYYFKWTWNEIWNFISVAKPTCKGPENNPEISYPCKQKCGLIGFWQVGTPKFSLENWLADGGEVASLTRQQTFHLRMIPDTNWLKFGCNLAERFRTIKNAISSRHLLNSKHYYLKTIITTILISEN